LRVQHFRSECSRASDDAIVLMDRIKEKTGPLTRMFES